jgi:hypothetical protein
MEEKKITSAALMSRVSAVVQARLSAIGHSDRSAAIMEASSLHGLNNEEISLVLIEAEAALRVLAEIEKKAELAIADALATDSEYRSLQFRYHVALKNQKDCMQNNCSKEQRREAQERINSSKFMMEQRMYAIRSEILKKYKS